jgi:hypothetical protein
MAACVTVGRGSDGKELQNVPVERDVNNTEYAFEMQYLCN